MRVITLNCNGIRSAAEKGLLAWIKRQRADVICLQEIKAQVTDLPNEILNPRGFHGYFFPAEKKGYSGTAVWSKKPADAVSMGLGEEEFDREGRYLELKFGSLSVVSLYLPSGSSSDEAQAKKFRFLKRFKPFLGSISKSKREYVLCGDWNIAHREIDLKNWRSNQKNSGFLPEERSWLSDVFEGQGFVDVFRTLNPLPEQYTWWSNRGRAWDNNVGWRIDYQIATPGIAATAEYTRIYKDQRFSDHAPLIIDYGYSL